MTARLKAWLVVGLLLGTAIYAIAEDITLTTYYPSPRGVYQELKTAGDMVVGDITNPPGARLHVVQEGTAPALRVDDVASDPSPFVIDQAGNVGIGTATPGAALEVIGNLKLVDGQQGDAKVLTADANGVASWEPPAGVPPGGVMFFATGPCPAGWTELAAAQGRYIVGVPAGGTLGLSVGTALSDGQDRPTGEHVHQVQSSADGCLSGALGACRPGMNPAGFNTNNTITPPGIPGTNAPYIQLLVCQKD